MKTCLGLLASGALLICSPAIAQVSQITTSAGLSASDSLFSIPGSSNGPVSSPITYATANNALTFSAAGGALEVDTVGVTYGASAYANGTRIIYAGGFSGNSAPLTLSFATPVSEFGFGAEEFNETTYLTSFIVNFTTNGVVGSSVFTSPGNDPNFLSFIGARAAAGSTINSVVISDAQGNNLSAGPVSFMNSTIAGAVPEVSTWGMMILGLGLVGFAMRRRQKITTRVSYA